MTVQARPVLGQRRRPKSAARVFIDLYTAQATFRGFVDFAAMGLIALLFLHGAPKFSMPWSKSSPQASHSALPAPPSQAAIDPSTTNRGLTALAAPPDFGRNAALAPRLSELGLDDAYFGQAAEPIRGKSIAAWRAYRKNDSAAALDILKDQSPTDRFANLVRGLASIAQAEDGAFRRGIGFLEQSAAAGDAKATAVLGVLKISGVPGLNRDLAGGQKLLLTAADSGDVDASRVVAEGYMSGWMGRIDPKRAAAYLKAGAERGEPKSAYRLAELLMIGRGVPQDEMEADRLLAIAAAHAHGQATTMLGFRKLTYFMSGITDDPAPALALLQRAADQGEPHSMLVLGNYYTQLAARIGALDYPRGLDYFRRCVDLTANADCAFARADALDRGVAGPRDVELIYALYTIASLRSNSATAKSKIDELARELKPEQIASATKRAMAVIAQVTDRRTDGEPPSSKTVPTTWKGPPAPARDGR